MRLTAIAVAHGPNVREEGAFLTAIFYEQLSPELRAALKSREPLARVGEGTAYYLELQVQVTVHYAEGEGLAARNGAAAPRGMILFEAVQKCRCRCAG